MPDIWMDVDVALAEVPVNIMPLIDDTDFKSRETAIVYNQAGMDLVWNFVTPAGAMTQTAVTPTSAGVHDWTNQGDGMYTLEIPASAGTINNDTEGFGWFTGVCTGVLPWRGPVIGFRRAALNDLFIEGGTASTNLEDFFDGTGYAGGTTPLNVNAAQISGDATAADNLETMLDGTGGQTLSLKQLNVVNTTGDAIVATSSGSNGSGINATGNGSGHGLKATGGATGNGIHGAGGGTSGSGMWVIGTNGDGISALGGTNGQGINAIGAGTGDGMQLTKGASGADLDADIVGDRTGNLSGSVGSVTGAVGSVTGNVGGNVTGSVGSVAAGGITATSIAADAIGASELAADAVAEIADAVWDEVLSGHLTAGSTGAALNAAGAAGDPWSTSIPGAYGAGTAGYIVGNNLNASITSRASQVSLDTLDDYVDTEVAAIKAKTDNLPASPAAVGSAMTLASSAIASTTFAAGAITASAIAADAIGASELAADAVAEIADAVWDELRSGHVGVGSFGEGVASVQGNVTGSVASVTGNVGGNVTGSVGSVGTGGITATSIAADAIGASELAADAVAEIADAVWDELRSGHVGAGSFGQGVASVQGNVTGSVASVTGAVGSVTGNVGGNVVGSVASVTGAVGSVTGNVGGNVVGSVASVTELSNALTEPAAAPAANASLKEKINWIFTLARNKITQTSSTQTLLADDGATPVATSATSDDGTTFTRGEWS